MSAGYRGARSSMRGGAETAMRQANADRIATKAQRVRKAAETASKAKGIADDHENQISTGVLKKLNIGEMALLNRLNGELPNRNIATLEDAAKIGDGVVAARTLISQDAASFNLWAQNAMIRSAAIQTLVVDKLAAGTFTAGDITIAGGGAIKAGGTVMNEAGFSAGGVIMNSGGLRAGRVIMNSGGLSMPALSDFEYSSINRDYKISSGQGNASLYWVTTSSSNTAVLQGDADGSRAGFSYMAAIHDDANFDNLTNATIRAYSYRPSDGQRSFVDIRAQNAGVNAREINLVADLDIGLSGRNIFLNGVWKPKYTGLVGNVPGNGGWREWEHNLGYVPNIYGAHWHQGNGQFRPLPTSGTAGLYIEFISAGRIRVTNNSGSGQNASVFVYG